MKERAIYRLTSPCSSFSAKATGGRQLIRQRARTCQREMFGLAQLSLAFSSYKKAISRKNARILSRARKQFDILKAYNFGELEMPRCTLGLYF